MFMSVSTTLQGITGSRVSLMGPMPSTGCLMDMGKNILMTFLAIICQSSLLRMKTFQEILRRLLLQHFCKLTLPLHACSLDAALASSTTAVAALVVGRCCSSLT